jgi:hypothetical protein
MHKPLTLDVTPLDDKTSKMVAFRRPDRLSKPIRKLSSARRLHESIKPRKRLDHVLVESVREGDLCLFLKRHEMNPGPIDSSKQPTRGALA